MWVEVACLLVVVAYVAFAAEVDTAPRPLDPPDRRTLDRLDRRLAALALHRALITY